ncbi:SMR family transporter [Arthrobacter rhombi]|uniref:DMT family transporter n=1 Tax=Arthrobacter rhombi TaxID=71253 RepID=UPI0031D7EC9D
MTKWILLSCAILSEVTGSMSLKAAMGHPGWHAVTAVGFVVAFICLSGVLRRGMPLGIAYGIWGATGVALTAISSAVVFNESLTGTMLAGIALIIAGVLTVELGSQRAADQAKVSG